MAKTTTFTKRALITKANRAIVLTTALASFLVIFCGVASKSLVSQASYQNRVISAKKKALTTLEGDLKTSTALVSSYKNFVNTPQNVIGGNPAGTGDKDGDNAKIILDALPSKYDFPALATSVEKLVIGQGLTIKSITGIDDELTQSVALQTGAAAEAVAMPFQVEVTGSYEAVRSLVNLLELSVRPFQILKIDLSGGEGDMNATIEAQTYYQAASGLNIRSEVVR
jgi:hypothetical protein